jgi:hypothetical protein
VKAALENELREMGRKALLAEAMAAMEAGCLCQQGGGFLASPGEAWPAHDGVRLVPILAVHTPELPHVPAFLDGYRYWTFFIEPDLFEQDVEGGTLVVRRYRDANDLTPLADGQVWPPYRLRFREVVDYPSRLALKESLAADPAVAAEFARNVNEVADRFPCHSGLKLGGYPCMIQGTHFLKTVEPDSQLQIDVCDTYQYADSGIGFVYANLQAVIWECM